MNPKEELMQVLQSIIENYDSLMRSQGASVNIGAIGSEFTAAEWIGSRLGGHIAKAQVLIAKAKGEV